jgi:flagellar biosynthesis/type III secretory pathway chaperone
MLTLLLREEMAAIADFHQLLLEEYAALKTHDLLKLKQLTAEKQVCTGRLQILIERRGEYLQQQEIGCNASAVEAYIACVTPSERTPLEALWASHQETLAQVKRQNEINGAIISASRNHVERALAILRGQDREDCLYSQGAQMTFGNVHHSLAKA